MNETFLQCNNPALDALYPRVKAFMLNDITEYNMMGSLVRGYRTPDTPSIWLRDYSDMMRAFKYWERDMTSIVDHFAEMQSAKGWLFDYFTMTPEKVPCEKENWAKYVRVPLEADVEFRFAKAVYQAWQATGNDRWLAGIMPHLERALTYVVNDPWRVDAPTGLVKRAFTVDTWDFDYTAGRHPWLNFQLNDETFWGVMHGDNSGYYEAFRQAGILYTALKNPRNATRWNKRADIFQKRTNELCFNGRFYAHHIHRVPVTIEGVDENEQLSLSNPMDINRGMATHPMAVAILKEYVLRGKQTGAFAEWFSIDPAFPDGMFGDEKLVAGAYCNGGIMPLVGGELARAAFEHGFEEYGVQQLLKYEQLTRNNESYLWYFPDGRHATVETSTSPDSSPTDAWGSSAMIYALMEGLAGIVDEGKLYRKVRLSPRWVAAGCDEVSVGNAYGASGASLSYTYAMEKTRRRLSMEIQGNAAIRLHLLLPSGSEASKVLVNGKSNHFRTTRIGESSYVDASFQTRGKTRLRVEW